MIDLIIKIFGMELHEITASVVLLGTFWLIAAVIRIKYRIKQFELNDIEEKKLMAETAKQLREATVQTAANLKEATIETAKHLKETTIETARVLASSDSPIKSCEKLLISINEKLDKVINNLDIVIDENHTEK